MVKTKQTNMHIAQSHTHGKGNEKTRTGSVSLCQPSISVLTFSLSRTSASASRLRHVTLIRRRSILSISRFCDGALIGSRLLLLNYNSCARLHRVGFVLDREGSLHCPSLHCSICAFLNSAGVLVCAYSVLNAEEPRLTCYRGREDKLDFEIRRGVLRHLHYQ